jgi:hypothetical protein
MVGHWAFFRLTKGPPYEYSSGESTVGYASCTCTPTMLMIMPSRLSRSGQCEGSLGSVRDVFAMTNRHIADHSKSMLSKQHEQDLATWRVRTVGLGCT